MKYIQRNSLKGHAKNIVGADNLSPFGKATQSSQSLAGRPENAINPPISNTFSLSKCSYTVPEKTVAWWMFQLSFGAAYITNITIYYRENYSSRMDGFKLFVTNTSTIPPDGYLCYEDPDQGLPNITQNIPCNQLGQYVINYDDKGFLWRTLNSTRYEKPVVELCYVAIKGCQKTFWGSNCDKMCSENCIEQHCYPQNGSCVWGCNTEHCLNDICDKHTAVCTDGCKDTRTGNYCNKCSANKEEDISKLSAQIGLFIGGFLLGALIAPIVCFLVMKKRHFRKKKDNLTPFGKATQSSQHFAGRPENAINPPISNTFSIDHCSHTKLQKTEAWWMFQLSIGAAYITNVTIYYRENYAYRMDGFKLYVTNTSTIPPDGYLCYEDPDPGLPNITQTITCNQLGQYIIYYDNKGSEKNSFPYEGPIVELCYVSIKGCPKSFWGSNCDKNCTENCIERQCYPGNGSCVWGCNTKQCLNDICDIHTAFCTNGCKERRTGNYCNKYNIASAGIVAQTPNGNQPSSLANDGNKTSCSKTKGPNVTFQIDLQKKSIVTEVHITFGGM
ncbi:unnamed protein product [Mytilus coruscus]|uniref:MEGF10_11 n=1 Tax=Mytilus coruscus TaxID=42192 RepID=A0A6J8EB82_MYTCO|nr:unnamed protein product [Mytilus coruscus]